MRRALIAFSVLLGLAIFGGGGSYLYYLYAMAAPIDRAGGEVEVLLEGGTNWDSAADRLQEEGLVPHPLLFELRARQRGRRVSLEAGLYRFEKSMSPDEIMDKLAAGPDDPLLKVPLKFQVIPGANIFRVAEHTSGLALDGDLLEFASDPERVGRLRLPAPKALPEGAHTLLEGYLYPETYHLDRRKPSLLAAVQLATRQFRKVFRELKVEHATSYARLMQTHGLTDHDFVTLASLVEKEVAAHEEAPLVAAVFYNRLAQGEALMTDPTLVYGPDTWREVPKPRHRRDKTNPYNTYHVKRLPPGPICSPGRNALAAVLAPADTDAIYFVAMRDGTGRHAFSKTLEEHRDNIRRYLMGGGDVAN